MTESLIVCCGHGSGTPSKKNLSSYNASRYSSIASNGVRKGLVCVRRLKALTDAKRKEFHDTYAKIIGRNTYSQGLRDYVYTPYNGKYYSDCSSSICATFAKIGYPVPLLNTAGMYQSALFEDVPVVIAAGHIMNPEALKVGDILLYAGSDPSRPRQIGHVEAVYEMPNEVIEETPVEGTVVVNANQLNEREKPSTSSAILGVKAEKTVLTVIAKSGEWFRVKDGGWISRKYVSGWIKESGRYWYIDNGSYPINTIKKIGSDWYAFDNDGWMLTPDRISSSGAIIY